MTVARVIALLLGAGAAGCGGAIREESAPVVTIFPDDFVLRDVRKDAAPHLRCQVPMVAVEAGPWAGSQGNIVAYGCGFRLTYYVACQTAHLCEFSIAE